MKIGDKVIVMNLDGGHNYQIGVTYEICYFYGNNNVQLKNGNFRGNQININSIKLSVISIKELEKELKKKKDDLNILKIQIDYLNDTKNENIDNGQFMAWYLLKLMKSDDKDKDKKMSRIINNLSNDLSINILKNTY